MKFKAEIDVMPLDALLDPQGKAVTNSMSNIGLSEIEEAFHRMERGEVLRSVVLL